MLVVRCYDTHAPERQRLKAPIYKFNKKNKFVALQIGDSPISFSILEILDSGEFAIDDWLEWKDHYTLGHTQVKNLRTGETLSGYFQNHDVHRDLLLVQLQITPN